MFQYSNIYKNDLKNSLRFSIVPQSYLRLSLFHPEFHYKYVVEEQFISRFPN